ncbi:DUF4292 domain-containing protein [Lutibacter holmesii]|uniref:DUF4292 domain-containing protein n=1 Tax=Lutibacter holmesii TaxID=1137985 RepID=A0ABW3WLL8_9FLAO
MKYSFKIIMLLFLIFTSCKSKKNIAGANAVTSVSTKKIIHNHYENVFDQETIDARLNAKYKDKSKSVSINIKMRLEKDKTIWMSATKFGIPVAKVLITPTKVSYYEKLSNTYFDGDFSLLSKWLGTELDYEKIQNLLLGQALFNLKEGRYSSAILNETYQLTPKKKNELFAILFFLNSKNFKLDKQEIRHPEKAQTLLVSYPNYQEINGQQIPKNVDITATDNKKTTNINIEYRSVEFNKQLTFPFSIPSGYTEITLK